MSVKILIADNHTFFRESFRSRLSRFGSVEEIQEVTEPDFLRKLAANKRFDILFVDRNILGRAFSHFQRNLCQNAEKPIASGNFSERPFPFFLTEAAKTCPPILKRRTVCRNKTGIKKRGVTGRTKRPRIPARRVSGKQRIRNGRKGYFCFSVRPFFMN